MVNRKKDLISASNPSFCLHTWLESLTQHYSSAQVKQIQHACDFLFSAMPAQAAASLDIAIILTELKLDYEALCAAILYLPLQQNKFSLNKLGLQFNTAIQQLLNGLLQLDNIRTLQQKVDKGASPSQHENVRRMLVAMVDDARVVLIKLAERLQTLRMANRLAPALRQQIAEEVKEIYAPLANRLGVWQFKWELEDLAFRYLQPKVYTHIAKAIKAKRIERDGFVQAAMDTLRARLNSMGVTHFELSGRAKHIYSIYVKMQRKAVAIDEIYDASAIRVLVPDIADCYVVLSVVHDLWPQILQEFDDYIAHPKPNGYRSIHTAVVGQNNNNLEIQIRTFQMHEQAELGIAAHWAYKEGRPQKPKQVDKLTWLRQLLEWQNECLGSPQELPETESFNQQVFIFTPSGDIIDLPKGATPLDFAYAIHSEIGHRCKGAKVNGNIVPLTYPLQTGEQVEILTAKLPSPSRDWLSPHHGYLFTHKAKAKVQQWFRLQDQDLHVAEGQEQLHKELAKIGMASLNLDELAHKMQLSNAKELAAAIGSGTLRLSQVIATVAQSTVQAKSVHPTAKSHPHRKHSSTSQALVDIDGVPNLLTQLAGCCKPVLGDAITGYITHGHYVSIHRQTCPNILDHQGDPRLVEVQWNAKTDYLYTVDLQILSQDRPDLLRDISSSLYSAKINIIALNFAASKTEVIAKVNLTIEVTNNDQIVTASSLLKQLVGVTEVKRLH